MYFLENAIKKQESSKKSEDKANFVQLAAQNSKVFPLVLKHTKKLLGPGGTVEKDWQRYDEHV